MWLGYLWWRESDIKAKIEWYMSVPNEQAHHRCCDVCTNEDNEAPSYPGMYEAAGKSCSGQRISGAFWRNQLNLLVIRKLTFLLDFNPPAFDLPLSLPHPQWVAGGCSCCSCCSYCPAAMLDGQRFTSPMLLGKYLCMLHVNLIAWESGRWGLTGYKVRNCIQLWLQMMGFICTCSQGPLISQWFIQ